MQASESTHIVNQNNVPLDRQWVAQGNVWMSFQGHVDHHSILEGNAAFLRKMFAIWEITGLFTEIHQQMPYLGFDYELTLLSI